MTLPGIDLTGVVDAINANTAQLQRVADAMTADNDGKVKNAIAGLEKQYRDQITDLTSRLPNRGSTFPSFPGPIAGGLGPPPA